MLRLSKCLLKQTNKGLARQFCSSFAAHQDNFLSGENAVYTEIMYEKWLEDRGSVHSSWDAYFTNLSRGLESNEAFKNPPVSINSTQLKSNAGSGKLSTATGPSYLGVTAKNVAQEKLTQLIREYRRRAHELADIDPLSIEEHKLRFRNPFKPVEEDPEAFGFSKEELNTPIEYYSKLKGFHSGKTTWSPAEASEKLKQIYAGPISFEYLHIPNYEVQDWIRARVEKIPAFEKTKEEKEELLNRVLESQAFTDFCERKYSSAKRFGIDGLDSTICGMEHLVDCAKEEGVSHVIFGMAHRGRLNTLACVFDKPYEAIFTEFKDPGIAKNVKSAEWGFAGDVKYHLGASNIRQYKDGTKVSMTMLPNPSHLETVDPVVLGKAKAKMDVIGDKNGDRVITVIVHGDAAFSGQGVVYETLQMESLKGYTVQGSVHVVFNNNIGFTTNPSDARSTTYCTDIMKATNSFIIHVNADRPEHVDYAFKLAMEYRQRFRQDVIIDVVGYRKFGHNEQDMPKFTQPKMYQRVEGKTPMWKSYAQELVDTGVFTQAEIDAKYAKYVDVLEKAFEAAKTENFNHKEWDSTVWKKIIGNKSHGENAYKTPITAIPEDQFKTIGKKINTLPTGKTFHSIILKVYEARLKAIESGKGVDWAGAEALAFATLLEEGHGIRLSGEDVRRGTFSHRHATLTDQKDNSRYYPIRSLLSEDEARRFQVFNSPLSEYGVLGFDYGYSIGNPNYLTIWEAQFGDFANVAQPVIDQYVAGGERKWGTKSGLVMLLPHGFDGQGPEHSSCRVERYLQLMDDDPYDEEFFNADHDKQLEMANMSICNITEPANYFHALRRQVLRPTFRKPLIVLSPKRLLRLKDAKSNIEDFTKVEKFREVLPDVHPTLVEKSKVKQVIFVTGQLYYDLKDRRNQLKRDVTFYYFRMLLLSDLNK